VYVLYVQLYCADVTNMFPIIIYPPSKIYCRHRRMGSSGASRKDYRLVIQLFSSTHILFVCVILFIIFKYLIGRRLYGSGICFANVAFF